jgi:hypothetical protein
MAFTNLEKTDMVLIYGEARGYLEVARQIYGERFLPNARTIVNVVRPLRDFERLGRQREDRILVTEEEILHEIEKQPRTSTRRLANYQGVSQFASSKRRSGNS